MPTYAVIPGVDENYNFPPQINIAMAESSEIVEKIKDLTVPTDALLGGRISLLESAANFPNPPLALEDSVMNGILSNEFSQSRETLDTFYTLPIAGLVAIDAAALDMAAEIQSKVDDTEAGGGGTVQIPKRLTEINLLRTVYLPSNVRIVGQSKSTKIGAIGDFPLFANKYPGVRQDNAELFNLEIRRYGSNSQSPIVDWTYMSHGGLRNLKIEQGTARANSTGILFGAYSYYNDVSNVQVRETHIGIKFVNHANGNRLSGSVSVLYSDIGYYVDESNSNSFFGAAVELCDEIGFLFTNGAKQNQVFGPRIESVPVGIRVEWSVTNPAFANFFIGAAFYMGAGAVEYDIQTDNVVIEGSSGLPLKNLKHYTQRTFVSAFSNVSQSTLAIGTWTKVLMQSWETNYLGELSNSTVTVKNPGLYSISSSVTFPTSVADNIIQLAVYKNNVLWTVLDKRTSIGSSPTRLTGGLKMVLAAGDKIELWANVTKNVNILSGRQNVLFQIAQDA